MTPKQKSYENTAKAIIKKLEQRGMEGYYLPDGKSARDKVLEMMSEGSSVTWGGSETMVDIGVIEAVKAGDYDAIDRWTKTNTDEEAKSLKAQIYNADYFLMSTNAITLDGELVNVDGNGNRVACLINGPKYVIIVAGMNKIVTDVEEGINRSHLEAAPPNAVRIGIGTPCEVTGVCSKCKGNSSMCCHTVITRSSRHQGRIKVILVGEELGY
jgi:Uncharacterised ACR, YkgG family COG1556.